MYYNKGGKFQIKGGIFPPIPFSGVFSHFAVATLFHNLTCCSVHFILCGIRGSYLSHTIDKVKP